MSITVLKKMISNIDNSKPINLARFTKIIKSLNLRHRFSTTDIKANKVKGDNYLITNITDNLEQELKNYVGMAGDDRISAAQQNDTHRHNVIGSYLLLLRASDLPAHPIVVLFDGQGNPKYPIDTKTPAEHGKDLLLLENRQLFIDWEDTTAFLRKQCGFASTDYDVVFSAGNEISNKLHKSFLAKYDTLYFCFDIDLGGLNIARNIIKLTPGTAYKFLMPDDIESRLAKVVNQISMTTLNKVREIGNQYAGLQPTANVISRHNKTIEQESFLYVPKS